uniref:Uncharacterized protein n=1 Tax=Arundo donax TaxID=35708 RepID=A0A0A9GQI0_ARUDO
MNKRAGGINRGFEPLADWQHLKHTNKVNFAEKCSLKTQKWQTCMLLYYQSFVTT